MGEEIRIPMKKGWDNGQTNEDPKFTGNAHRIFFQKEEGEEHPCQSKDGTTCANMHVRRWGKQISQEISKYSGTEENRKDNTFSSQMFNKGSQQKERNSVGKEMAPGPVEQHGGK